MKSLVLILTCLASGQALAGFEKRKQGDLMRITRTMAQLHKLKACIEKAGDEKEMDACRISHRETRLQMQEARSFIKGRKAGSPAGK